jgi:predicted XRE-type DNA-binding protein
MRIIRHFLTRLESLIEQVENTNQKFVIEVLKISPARAHHHVKLKLKLGLESLA